ncbi:hypothetical protein [Streptomyces sp. SID12501]|uniref:Serine hydrolase n=1 Tax=Streptomyces sp. SID12501 TaxID=2706042 RepID=A0A6B3BF87_9ACTN|nr:hypothetical protein [Streptomyces sp. SID12501]NEC85117.1 hypothetical protein [Streptomyces sp. SID12501]
MWHISSARGLPTTTAASRALLPVAALLLGLTTAATSTAAPVPPVGAEAGSDRTVSTSAAQAQIPAGVTAGVVVYDRQTGTFTEQVNASMQFRSASVVKLLLTLDFFRDRGPNYTIPAADRALLEPMLRSSYDEAADHYWVARGGPAIIDRMVTQLGLSDTVGPPAGMEGFWGYTAISARDTVKIYRYILEQAPAPVREFIMTNLRQSTRCASDAFDQHFGIAAAFDRPWAVKQGWSGEYEDGTCGPSGASNAEAASKTSVSKTSAPNPAADNAPEAGSESAARTPAVTRAAAQVDLARPALHTTGTVGTGDRAIVAVLTLHPVGTSYGKAYTDLGRLTRSLDVPGATRPAGKWYGTWGSGVNVREAATTARSLTRLPAGVEVLISCQKQGETVSVPPYTNNWWAYLPQYGGYMSNIYVSSPDNKLPDVPVCATA